MCKVKICTVCSTEKPITEYHPLKTGTFGTRADCRDCRKAANRNYYHANREVLRQRDNLRRVRKKPEGRKMFSDCGVSMTDETHVWYKCSTCNNQYQREVRKVKRMKELRGIPVIEKRTSKFCKCAEPILMKTHEDGNSYCKTCAKPTNI